MHGNRKQDFSRAEFQYLSHVIAGPSHNLARKYRNFMEMVDIRQELWLWCVRHPGETRELLDTEEEEKKSAQTLFRRGLYLYGDKICRREKAKQSGYRPSDEFMYTRQLLELLMEAKFNDAEPVFAATDERVKRNASVAEGGNVVAMMADLNRALASLDEPRRNLITLACGAGMPTRDLAAQLGVTRQAIEARVDRIITKMIDVLGGPVSPY